MAEDKGKSKKSLGVVDISQDGSIYMEVGTAGNLITQIGKTSSINNFSPYSTTIEDVKCLHPYKIIKGEFPATIKSKASFIQNLVDQYDINEYVQNWIRMGADELKKYLFSKRLVNKDTVFILLNNGRSISNAFFLHLTNSSQYRYDSVLELENLDTVQPNVSEDTPDDVKNYLENYISQVNREDRNYSLDSNNIDKKLLKYLDGYIKFDEESFKNISGSNNVVLVHDFINNDSHIFEAIRVLKTHNFWVSFTCAIA